MFNRTSLLRVPMCLVYVRLRVISPLTFYHFYHGNVIRALLMHVLQENIDKNTHGLPAGVVPIVLENGRLSYPPGQDYIFGVVCVGNAIPHAECIVRRLKHPGFRTSGILQVNRNVRVQEIEMLDQIDLFKIHHRLLNAQPEAFSIRLLTPLSIPREKRDRCPGHARYDQQLFRLEVFLKKIIDRFNNLCAQNIISAPPLKSDKINFSELQLANTYLTWIELPTNKRHNTYGGVVGKLFVQGNLNPELLALLVFGACVHVGEKINYGFGFFDLPELFPNISSLFQPTHYLLDAALDDENLFNALQQLQEGSPMPGEDAVLLNDLTENFNFWKQTVRQQIRKRTYTPAPLTGIVLKKASKIRALAVPSVVDRWLQRAVLNVLAPVIDTLLEDCSYAYRRNYSRRQARAAIRKAYEEGYRYVVEADIENFFDEVEWNLLFARLQALFPFEPLVELIEKWVKSPVMFKHNLIERRKGVPQGAVISPLLSNLYLDTFDEQITKAGFKLIRFADDFVILCKTREEAIQALNKARQALEQLDLQLKPSKTQITHFDSGFRYLGYLFCRSVILETLKKDDSREFDWGLLDENKIPPNSWLANARFNGQSLNTFLQQKRRQIFHHIFQQGVALKNKSYKKTVYLGNYGMRIKVKHKQLLLIDPRKVDYTTIEKIPLEHIQQIVLLGPVSLSMPAIFRLSRYKIPIGLATSQGRMVATIHPHISNLNIWLKQQQKFQNPEFQVAFSRAIIMAKIHNYTYNYKHLQWSNRKTCLQELSALKNACLNKNSIDTIRGIEGKAAAVVYANFGEILEPEWNFTHRRKHPPPDPINALLSLGYTLLYNYLTTLILGQGLNPQVGIFHKSRPGFNALSADFQEEFRFLIDRLLLTLIHRRQLRPEHFDQPEKMGKYMHLKKPLKKFFITQVEKKLGEQLYHPVAEKHLSYLEIMEYQVLQIKEIINEQRYEYRPFLRR